MVSPPKNLSDLHRIEAQVRVTCTSCKATEVWELGALVGEVCRNDGNTDWRAARRSIKCPRRCLVPFTAFSGQTRGADGKLALHWFDMPNRPIVSFAGAGGHWKAPVECSRS